MFFVWREMQMADCTTRRRESLTIIPADEQSLRPKRQRLGRPPSKATPAPGKATQSPPLPSYVTTLKGPGAPPVPSIFNPLVSALEQMRKEGLNRPLRSQCAMRLLSQDAQVFKKAGATTWGDYAAVAEAAGIITLGDGSKPGMEWIALRSIHDNATLKLNSCRKDCSREEECRWTGSCEHQ